MDDPQDSKKSPGVNTTELLASLSDDQLRTLRSAFPVDTSDPLDPRYHFHRRIVAECERRGLD
jgi:hypothetical protein